MKPLLARRAGYSRAEYLSDLAVHVVGLLAVVASVPALVAVASLTSDAQAPVAATLLYGCCLAAMIVCSAVYNIFPHPDWEWLLKRLDHSAIYLKIAGTVTGFALIAGKGWLLVSGLWIAAALGIALKLAAPFGFRWLGLGLYLGMGWSAGVMGHDIFGALPAPVMTLIAFAGFSYTVGVGFYLWDRLPFHFTIWHICVLIGSFAIYAAVFLAVIGA